MTEELRVGQKLFFVSSQRRGGQMWVTVEKIGRKWAKVTGQMQIDKDTLIANGGNFVSPGRAYLSREDYEKEVARMDAWMEFRRGVERLGWQPDHVTIEQIKEASKAIGL